MLATVASAQECWWYWAPGPGISVISVPSRRTLPSGLPWEQSVFEAFKFIEKEVKRISGIRGKTGYTLMMDAGPWTKGVRPKVRALIRDSPDARRQCR